jgi:protein-S-isoprenylcysteine O-methyltransferase Ste14
VAAFVVAVLMFSLSFAVVTAQRGLVARLRSRAPDVKRAGGFVLIAVGLWMLILSVFAGVFADVFPV